MEHIRIANTPSQASVPSRPTPLTNLHAVVQNNIPFTQSRTPRPRPTPTPNCTQKITDQDSIHLPTHGFDISILPKSGLEFPRRATRPTDPRMCESCTVFRVVRMNQSLQTRTLASPSPPDNSPFPNQVPHSLLRFRGLTMRKDNSEQTRGVEAHLSTDMISSTALLAFPRLSRGTVSQARARRERILARRQVGERSN